MDIKKKNKTIRSKPSNNKKNDSALSVFDYEDCFSGGIIIDIPRKLIR